MSPAPWNDEQGPDGLAVGAFGVMAPPYRPRWWLHILLFVATLVSTTFIGAIFWGALPAEMGQLPLSALLLDPRVLFAGLQFSLPLLTILTCHELGHYMACRRHGLVATPPFFIPFPLPVLGIGTLGAVIRIKEPIRTSRQLMDVGAAGPIAGFLALLPFLGYGIAASEVAETVPDGSYIVFGEPLIYRLLERAIVSDVPEGMGLMLHPTGVAAWFGVLITLLNMLPFAQLDGGHVSYALFGRWHRRGVWVLLAALAALGFLWPGWWLWTAIVLVMGVKHPPMWDEDLPLDPRRRLIGVTALAIFVLCFTTEPISLVLGPPP